ncbi:cache domain-containing sensor histidine kinase [Lachnotalea glycerini]|uniref:Sensor histidine kinase n=1 Tax=Lachnotalea glycerini TaxID=1763509 RepID=A0A371JIM9_9FIRM|nr:sensor histidine kinase [Lachnotalea glycerini]RDY32592.1 sensor histidine kinase [Lachnotalea glycerini]
MIQFVKKIVLYYTQDMKLQSKFILSHLILVIAPTILIVSILLTQLSDILLSNTVLSEQNLSKQTADYIENCIAQVNNASTSIIENAYFSEILNSASYDIPFESSDDFVKDTTSFLSSIHSSVDGFVITGIKIYLTESFQSLYDNPIYSSYQVFEPLAKVQGSYWHGIFSSTSKKYLVCPSLYLTPSECENLGELAIIRKMNYVNDIETPAAYVVVYFSKSNIDFILGKDLSISDSSTYLINERNSIVSTSNSSLSGKYILDYKTVQSKLTQNHRFITMTLGGEKVYAGCKEIPNTDWYMVSVIPTNNAIIQIRDIVFQLIGTYMIFLAFACFIALLLSNSIVKRIKSIINQMKLVRKSTPKRLLLKPGHDEIGDLIDTYNYMTDEINNLLKQQVKASTDLRLSEFKALQAQINPHFLYNTLDMINWLSKMGKIDEVCAAVQALSKFYKLTLNRGNITVSVKEELEHVSLYVQLQNMRYQDKIHFIIDVPDELLDYEIPKLVFQPIVENSIQHGIFAKESKEGNIVIMGWLENDIMVFVISDDGVGIPEGKLKSVLTGTLESTCGSNIGISNTHKRLQLFYDLEYGLIYRSTPCVETEVEIRIPAKKFIK